MMGMTTNSQIAPEASFDPAAVANPQIGSCVLPLKITEAALTTDHRGRDHYFVLMFELGVDPTHSLDSPPI